MSITTKTVNKREPTLEEAEAIKKLVRAGDPYKESGGIIYHTERQAAKAFVDASGKPRKKRIGNVTSEDNHALCRSTILWDWNSHNWENIKAVWIAAELPKPAGYVDECCDGCEERNIPDRPRHGNSLSENLQFTDRTEEIPAPRKDFVSPGQRAWADKFGVTVVVYQLPSSNPEKGFEDGAWDIYDPSTTERKAIGMNLKPLSKLAGISSTDPAHLNAVAKVALEERAHHELQIYQAWADYMKVYQASIAECSKAYEEMIAANPAREKRLKTALKRMEKLQGTAVLDVPAPQQKAPNFATSTRRSPAPVGKSYALPPASAQTLADLRFRTPPMEAFEYVEVSSI
jgi:hypothetical protein